MAKQKQVIAYNDDYLKLGFISVKVNGEVRPQCVLCLKVLAQSSLKEVKLHRHLEANHEKFVSKTLDVFIEKIKRSCIDRLAAWGGVAYCHNKAVRASFFVSWKIAREKAPHTAGENLIKPAAVEMAWILCGDIVSYGYKLAMVSF